MLPKTNRIGRKQWDALFKASKKMVFSWGLVRHSDINGKLRTSVVVSKKVAKLSVSRHIIKRFLYSLFDNKREIESSFIIHVSNWKFNDHDFLKNVARDIENISNKQDELRSESTQ